MGWCSGTSIALAVISNFPTGVNVDVKIEYYCTVIHALFDLDWDCEGDMAGFDNDFDIAMKRVYDELGLEMEWDGEE